MHYCNTNWVFGYDVVVSRIELKTSTSSFSDIFGKVRRLKIVVKRQGEIHMIPCFVTEQSGVIGKLRMFRMPVERQKQKQSKNPNKNQLRSHGR